MAAYIDFYLKSSAKPGLREVPNCAYRQARIRYTLLNLNPQSIHTSTEYCPKLKNKAELLVPGAPLDFFIPIRPSLLLQYITGCVKCKGNLTVENCFTSPHASLSFDLILLRATGSSMRNRPLESSKAVIYREIV